MLHLPHHSMGSSSNDNSDGYENVTKWRWFPLLGGGLFVLWGGWGERKRERAGHDGKGKREERLPPFSSSHRSPRAFYFLIMAIFIGIPQTRTQSLFMCFWGEIKLGVRLRRARYPVPMRPRAPQLTPNLLSHQKHINSGWIRV